MATTRSPKGNTKIRKSSPKTGIAKKSLVKKAAASLSTNGKKAVVRFTPTKLKLLRPVPSDIEIAQAGKLKPILQIAAELGIRENELELFGPYKAKVKLEILASAEAVIRSCQRRTDGSGERPCSANRSRPSGASVRLASASAPTGSGTVHSV